MPAQIGYFDSLKSVAGKVFAYLASITLTGVDGKTLTVNDSLTLALGAANLKWFMNAAGTAPEWAKGIKVHAVTYNVATATGTQAVTGIGFKPSAVILLGNIDGTDDWSVGFGDGTTDGNIHWVSSTQISSGGSLIELVVSAGNHAIGVINSFDADGFIIGWTKTGLPTGTGYIKILAFR